MKPGSLLVVGSGIQVITQVTLEARLAIEQADKVLYGTDSVTARWIHKLNPNAESLDTLFQPGKQRISTYRKTVERILAEVRLGRRVCVVYYGHPGVFVFASHESIRIAREEGHQAKMLAGVSAEDCLFADMWLDPGICGHQSFEATDFLIRRRIYDPASPLILWQVGVIGELGYGSQPNINGIKVLMETLEPVYGLEHIVYLYIASQFQICPSSINKVCFGKITEARITPFSTLYIPPKEKSKPDPVMMKRLGI